MVVVVYEKVLACQRFGRFRRVGCNRYVLGQWRGVEDGVSVLKGVSVRASVVGGHLAAHFVFEDKITGEGRPRGGRGTVN